MKDLPVFVIGGQIRTGIGLSENTSGFSRHSHSTIAPRSYFIHMPPTPIILVIGSVFK